MEHFDELVTDPTVRLADVEAHLTTLSGGDGDDALTSNNRPATRDLSVVRWWLRPGGRGHQRPGRVRLREGQKGPYP